MASISVFCRPSSRNPTHRTKVADRHKGQLDIGALTRHPIAWLVALGNGNPAPPVAAREHFHRRELREDELAENNIRKEIPLDRSASACWQYPTATPSAGQIPQIVQPHIEQAGPVRDHRIPSSSRLHQLRRCVRRACLARPKDFTSARFAVLADIGGRHRPAEWPRYRGVRALPAAPRNLGRPPPLASLPIRAHRGRNGSRVARYSRQLAARPIRSWKFSNAL
jgi:hypothetical protein